jgi:hypothetical protein
MRKLLFIAAAVTTVGLAAPAAAQVYGYADPGGVGVRVGPLGAGIGSDPYYRHHGRYAYGYGDCRTIRERMVTPSGRVIFQERRICD